MEVRTAGEQMAAILGLTGSPMGVCLLVPGQPRPPEAGPLRQHRSCQALMKARRAYELINLGLDHLHTWAVDIRKPRQRLDDFLAEYQSRFPEGRS